MKIVCIIQARLSSTRLPRKILLKVCGKEIIIHLIERVLHAKKIDEIVIATTTKQVDAEIENLIKEYNNKKVKVFRGSEENVLDRFYQAAKQTKADVVIRITGDCPLIDWEVIDKVISEFEKDNYDYVSNVLDRRTYPRGLDVEVFSFDVLEKMWKICSKQKEKEHVTVYIRENKNKFKTKNVENDKDLSNLRWTLDEKDDFILIKKIYDELFINNSNFKTKDILRLLDKKPELSKINQHVEQKKNINTKAN